MSSEFWKQQLHQKEESGLTLQAKNGWWERADGAEQILCKSDPICVKAMFEEYALNWGQDPDLYGFCVFHSCKIKPLL